MKNRSKKLVLTLMLATSVALLASGCDKLKKNETEAQTEAPTEKITEAPTEKITEAPTEEPTEAPTESESETQTQPQVLTVEEELAQETEFDQLRTMYAMDDVNVRTQPGTDDETCEIFYSFYQGDRVTVVGETPNWCVVSLDDYESDGYVSKQFLSDTEVAEKTDEERQQLIEQQLSGSSSTSGETSGGSDSQSGSSSQGSTSSADTAAVDQEFGVQAYAESYPVYAMTGANLRSTPSQDGTILQTIASGSSLKAVGYTDRWYKVEVDGTVGYVNKNLFSNEPTE